MRIVNNILYDYSDIILMACLGETLIYSETWEDYMKRIKLGLKIVSEHKLYEKLSKHIYGSRCVENLGFMLSAEELALDPSKTIISRHGKIFHLEQGSNNF